MKQKIDAYLHSYCMELISSESAPDNTLIITPDLMNALGRHIPTHYGDIIFINFEGLHLKNDLKVRGNIWIVDSTILSLEKVNCWGQIHLVRSDLDPITRMETPDNPIFMDEESFKTYMSNKRKNRNIINNSIVLMNEELLESRLDTSMEHVMKIDILSYLFATHEDVSFKDTDQGILIEGNKILLSGPYQYDFSNVHEIKADVEIHDEFKQVFGGTKIGGQLAVINRY